MNNKNIQFNKYIDELILDLEKTWYKFNNKTKKDFSLWIWDCIDEYIEEFLDDNPNIL